MKKSSSSLASLLIWGFAFLMLTAFNLPEKSRSSKKEQRKEWKQKLKLRKKNIKPLPMVALPTLKSAIIGLDNRHIDIVRQLTDPAQNPHLPVIKPIILPKSIRSSMAFLQDSIVSYAKKFLGVRYRHSGKNEQQGFDCSGFTSYVMSNFGYELSPSSFKQSMSGVVVNISQAQKGDLLFFGYEDRRHVYRVSHAALVISEKGEPLKMIHASSGRRGVVIDDINSSSWKSYYAKRLLFVKRVLAIDQELIAAK
ncbi:MAG: NlpC/P60 family protein [Bacteroidetes bacterium]|nr:MAG: NlpC/P60 family protein [Bacteroidota bacterium]